MLLFAISAISFILLIVGSGNVGRSKLGVNATNEQVAQLNAELGLNRPVVSQYASWLGKAIRGDFGKAWFGTQSVVDTVKDRVPVTLYIVTGSVIVASVLAILFGVAAAVRGRAVDGAVQLVGLLGFAVPGFLIAFWLVNLFAIKFHLFRATGYVAPTDSFSGWLRSITLPIVSLAMASLASVSLQVRGSVKDALAHDYVRTLRSRGLSDRSVLYKHVLRNAAGPALSIIGLQFIGLLGGAVIVEKIFAIPGMGDKAVDAAAQGDVPVVMGLVMITAILVVIVNLIIDLLTAWLNPKVRLS